MLRLRIILYGMDGTGVIYRHTYTGDGRSYIGQSIYSEQIRTKGHLKSKDSTYFHRAIRKYGWDNFTTEILHENIDPMCSLVNPEGCLMCSG